MITIDTSEIPDYVYALVLSTEAKAVLYHKGYLAPRYPVPIIYNEWCNPSLYAKDWLWAMRCTMYRMGVL